MKPTAVKLIATMLVNLDASLSSDIIPMYRANKKHANMRATNAFNPN
jgi:hypothetical protein